MFARSATSYDRSVPQWIAITGGVLTYRTKQQKKLSPKLLPCYCLTRNEQPRQVGRRVIVIERNHQHANLRKANCVGNGGGTNKRNGIGVPSGLVARSSYSFLRKEGRRLWYSVGCRVSLVWNRISHLRCGLDVHRILSVGNQRSVAGARLRRLGLVNAAYWEFVVVLGRYNDKAHSNIESILARLRPKIAARFHWDYQRPAIYHKRFVRSVAAHAPAVLPSALTYRIVAPWHPPCQKTVRIIRSNPHAAGRNYSHPCRLSPPEQLAYHTRAGNV